MHVAAALWPSGVCNYCTQAIAEYPGGAEVLRRWCNAIVASKMAAWVSRLRAGALALPLVKSDGQTTRPVVCGEALFEFVRAVCFAPCNDAVDRSCGPSSLVARKPGGAGQMVVQVSTARELAPIVVCTDARRTFGSALRSSVWKSALGACPSLAGVEQNLLGAGHTVVWAEVGNGT